MNSTLCLSGRGRQSPSRTPAPIYSTAPPIMVASSVSMITVYTWLLGHRAGLSLTSQSGLLNSAIRTLYRLSRECFNSSYEVNQQDSRILRRRQDVYRLTGWCRSRSVYIDKRREATYVAIPALKGFLSLVRASSGFTGHITRRITKEGWAHASAARRRAELDWKFGRTRKRPRHLMMMPPRRQVIVDEITRNNTRLC